MTRVYSMGGIERAINGDTVQVSLGEHTPAGYVPRESVTVQVRPSYRLPIIRVCDLLASAAGQAAARGEHLTPNWARDVIASIARDHDTDPSNMRIL